MQIDTIPKQTGEFSVRRTVLTLIGAVFAFGVLTASYATADLPETAPAIGGIAVSVR